MDEPDYVQLLRSVVEQATELEGSYQEKPLSPEEVNIELMNVLALLRQAVEGVFALADEILDEA